MSEKKVKFTVADAVIILIILAAAAFGAVKLLPSVMSGTEKELTTFTVMAQNKEEDFGNAVTIGDNVTISLTEKDGGVVRAVRTEPASQSAFNSVDGTYSQRIIPGKYDVYVTIEAETEVDDLGIRAGGTVLKVGAEAPVRGKGYASMGYIIEIDD